MGQKLDSVSRFFVKTSCHHCNVEEKHLRIGESHCDTDWIDDEYSPRHASDGHTFYCLKCQRCEQITIWHGFVPDWFDGDEYESEEDYDDHFLRFYKAIYPQVRLTRFWSYGVPRHKVDTKVQFFLDQADKAISIGIHNAAVLSFRSVLEALIDIDGTTKHTRKNGSPVPLGARLDELTSKTPPPDWVKHLDAKSLQFLKDIGNDSVHVRGLRHYSDTTSTAVREAIDIILQEFYRDTASKFKAVTKKVRAAKKTSKKVPSGKKKK